MFRTGACSGLCCFLSVIVRLGTTRKASPLSVICRVNTSGAILKEAAARLNMKRARSSPGSVSPASGPSPVTRKERSVGESSDSDSDPSAPGPALPPPPAPGIRQRVLPGERAFLSSMPAAARYCLSYMHRDVVTHCCAAATRGFLVSASEDGQLKFWARAGYVGGAGGAAKRQKTDGVRDGERPLEFVKEFRAHTDGIDSLALSPDGALLVTVGARDRTAKVFAVDSFDMLGFVELGFEPGPAVVWIEEKRTGLLRFAVAHKEEPKVSLFSAGALDAEPVVLRLPHVTPVSIMRFNAAYRAVVSVDRKGVIEYWIPTRGGPVSVADAGAGGPGEAGVGVGRAETGSEDGEAETGVSCAIPGVLFEMKGETDLYEFAKKKACPTSLELSADGKQFVCTATDRIVRVFNFRSGKLRRSYDESLEKITRNYRAAVAARAGRHGGTNNGGTGGNGNGSVGGDDDGDGDGGGDGGSRGDATSEADFTRRMQREAEVDASPAGTLWKSNAIFDFSGNFILYATVLGIKVVNLVTNKVVRTLGRPEGAERFLTLALFQEAAAGGSASGGRKPQDVEPLLVASAHASQRLYLFTRHEPRDGEERDVFNEKPRARRAAAATTAVASAPAATRAARRARRATLHTTCGDVTFATLPHCPRAVENFTALAARRYYDDVMCVRRALCALLCERRATARARDLTVFTSSFFCADSTASSRGSWCRPATRAATARAARARGAGRLRTRSKAA